MQAKNKGAAAGPPATRMSRGSWRNALVPRDQLGSWAAGGVVAAGILTKTVRRYIQHGRQAYQKKRAGARTSPPKSKKLVNFSKHHHHPQPAKRRPLDWTTFLTRDKAPFNSFTQTTPQNHRQKWKTTVARSSICKGKPLRASICRWKKRLQKNG